MGLVSPAFFIPLMEETGLIVPVGRWVLAEAIRQVRVWQQAIPEHRGLMISVNVSARQLNQPGLAGVVEDLMKRHDLRPECLKLEITESVVMDQPDQAIEVLKDLKALGVTLSIDDFGTGHSSLAYLDRLPADILKIDKTFVAGIKEGEKGTEIVRAILALAGALGKEVVAEGVETPRQLSALLKMGCDFAPGVLLLQTPAGRRRRTTPAPGIPRRRRPANAAVIANRPPDRHCFRA